LAVVNPLAESLHFASDRVRLRRDHAKYLALIDAIALLHQQQRKVQTIEVEGQSVEYIEVIASDIAMANRLAHAVLGRSLDELPPQTRRLLQAMQAWVGEQASVQAIPATSVRFTRRELREALGVGDTQLRVHLERLVELEYVALHGGRQGQRAVYALLFGGDAGSDAPQWSGLVGPAVVETSPAEGPTSRGADATSRGSRPNIAGGSRAVRGGVAAGSRGGVSTRGAP
jgi:DNA-binding transcriptional ArsR family regulator